MPQTYNMKKKTIAVFFGGRSPEHDVSVISALQVMDAIDQSRYTVLPVYIAPDGAWFIGDGLRNRDTYLLSSKKREELTEVTLDVCTGKTASHRGALVPKKHPFLGSAKPTFFDIAIPAFHGLYGEDGNIQGLFELANIPYTGMRTKASSVLMDKGATKHLLQALDIPTLDYAIIKRPDDGFLVNEAVLDEVFQPLGFPCILKPSHLGSSIGVAKVSSVEEAKACLPAIFEYDDAAIAEPFVQNLVEYNVAVTKKGSALITSAIERPKGTDELLDFKQKYMSGGDDKTGNKLGGTKDTSAPVSEGMLSLTREINPSLPKEMDHNIRAWACKMFDGIDGSGAPRIDFIGNKETGEIWMNEVNPCPGSFGYFLWEAAQNPLMFTDFLTHLIEEAAVLNIARTLPVDPVPEDARLLKRRG